MDTPPVVELRRLATDFRHAIEQTRAAKITPHLPYFPEGACKLASWLFALHLRKRGEHAIRFVTGHVPGFESYVRHAWLVVDGAVVDLTADPFGQAPVVVGAATPFHLSLGDQEETDAAIGIAAFSADQLDRYRRLLGPIETHMRDHADLAR